MSIALERQPSPRASAQHAGNVAYEITGPAHAPVVAVLGGISSSRHVTATSDNASVGWWENIVGRDKALDTRRFRVLSIDYLAEPAGGAPVGTSDQADALAAALDAVQVDRAHAIVGASYGGMVALAFGKAYPERAGRLIVISAAHASDPLATALRILQRRIVELGIETGRTEQALSIARGVATTAYGTAAEFRAQFAAGGDGAAETCARIGEHLAAAGDRFVRSCAAERFLALSRSLDLHHVRPEAIRVPTTLVAVREDQLVPITQARELASRLGASCLLLELESIHGHDAFLNDTAAFAPLLAAALSSRTGLTS